MRLASRTRLDPRPATNRVARRAALSARATQITGGIAQAGDLAAEQI